MRLAKDGEELSDLLKVPPEDVVVVPGKLLEVDTLVLVPPPPDAPPPDAPAPTPPAPTPPVAVLTTVPVLGDAFIIAPR